MLYKLIELIYLFIQAITLGVILYKISYIKLSKRKIIVFSLHMYALLILFTYFNMEKVVLIFIILVMIIYLYILTKNIAYSILNSIVALFVYALSDALAAAIMIYGFNYTVQYILVDPLIKNITVLVMGMLAYIISTLTGKVIKKIYLRNSLTINKKSIIFTVLCFLLAAISFIGYVVMFKELINTANNIIVLLNCIIAINFVVLTVIILYLNINNIKRDLEKDYKEKELNQLKVYTESIETVSTDLRNFKHDYINLLQILGSFIESESYSEMKHFYYKELVPESNSILEKNRCFESLHYIRNDALKSLISSKIVGAQLKSIKVNTEIIEDIDNIEMNVIDLCRIIGVLLDNAIEAAEICENKFIDFLLIKNKTSVTFIVNNSCPPDTPPVYKIYEKDFSTKGVNRGIGLKSLRAIIEEKYNNVLLNTQMEDQVFKQELIIMDKA